MGDCFEVAFRLVVDPLEEHGLPRHARLCHGYVTGQGPDVEGKRFMHAWVEVGAVVIDRSNGLDVTALRPGYYRLGQIDYAQVRRYSRWQAAGHGLREGHFGPWEEVSSGT
jgi:hypothetical protein